MEQLPNGYTLNVPAGCFPLSTDSMLLASFAKKASGSVLDLGSGCGTLGVLLCAVNSRLSVTGIEVEPAAHMAALENIQHNALSQRMESICESLVRVPTLFAPGSFSCCVSNPPYFSGGPAAQLSGARREDSCTLSQLMVSAAWALKYGGDFYLVHRPERLGEVISLGAANGLEAKRLGLVRHTAGEKISIILVQLRKGGKPGLVMEDWILRNSDGTPTQLYRKAYHFDA